MWRIDTFSELTSTQDRVLAQAKIGAAEGYVAHAIVQTQGRGRMGRKWAEGTGNLYASVLLRPSCKPSELGQLSLLTGLSIHNILLQLGLHPMLKWPNDILINNQKICGILMETDGVQQNESLTVIIGIGMNIAVSPLLTACCLADFIPSPPTSEQILDQILHSLEKNYKKWLEEGFEELRQDWVNCSCPINSTLLVSLINGPVKGTFEGINAQGNLILRTNEGLKTISSGDVVIEQKD